MVASQSIFHFLSSAVRARAVCRDLSAGPVLQTAARETQGLGVAVCVVIPSAGEHTRSGGFSAVP